MLYWNEKSRESNEALIIAALMKNNEVQTENS